MLSQVAPGYFTQILGNSNFLSRAQKRRTPESGVFFLRTAGKLFLIKLRRFLLLVGFDHLFSWEFLGGDGFVFGELHREFTLALSGRAQSGRVTEHFGEGHEGLRGHVAVVGLRVQNHAAALVQGHR